MLNQFIHNVNIIDKSFKRIKLYLKFDDTKSPVCGPLFHEFCIYIIHKLLMILVYFHNLSMF